MRGGTSRGPYFRGEDLPSDPAMRDRMLARIMGSGHELQVDGIGGGHPLTSKIAIVSRSTRPDADVDYLFAQASVLEAAIDTSPNCGNMLAGVGPFAIEAGLVAATRTRDPGAHPQRQHRQADRGHRPDPGRRRGLRGQHGHRRGAGHRRPDPPELPRRRRRPRPAACCRPGSVRDRILGVEVTCIDMAMPLVIMRAADFGKTGHERPAELDADTRVLRASGGDPPRGRRADGPRRRRRAVIPKPVLVSAAAAGGTLAVRYFTPARLPPRRGRHRCGRHRHGLRHAGQPRPRDSPARRRRARRRGS